MRGGRERGREWQRPRQAKARARSSHRNATRAFVVVRTYPQITQISQIQQTYQPVGRLLSFHIL